MIIDIFKQFNYLDIIIIIIILRICYIAVKTGLPIELFKLIGTFSAIYLSLHYYIFLSDLMRRKSDPAIMPLKFADFLIFIFLAIAGYLFFTFLRVIFFNFIKLEAVPALSKWGGLALGIFRGFFLVGLICFALSVSNLSYLNKSVMSSYLARRASNVAPDTYKWLWNTIFSKFMGSEKSNKNAVMALHNFFHR